MVNNCQCSRYHRTIVDSINERRFEIPYHQLEEGQKDKITKNVIEAKKNVFNDILSELKNYDAAKCGDKNIFKERFSTSIKFHKTVSHREKCEMIFEKCVIDKDVERIYPATREEEFIIRNLDDEGSYGYQVRHEEVLGHDVCIYYKTHQFNVVTGRVMTEGYRYKAYLEAIEEYKRAIRNEINKISNNTNEDKDCSII